jgi:hypothetical protein
MEFLITDCHSLDLDSVVPTSAGALVFYSLQFLASDTKDRVAKDAQMWSTDDFTTLAWQECLDT